VVCEIRADRQTSILIKFTIFTPLRGDCCSHCIWNKPSCWWNFVSCWTVLQDSAVQSVFILPHFVHTCVDFISHYCFVLYCLSFLSNNDGHKVTATSCSWRLCTCFITVCNWRVADITIGRRREATVTSVISVAARATKHGCPCQSAVAFRCCSSSTA